VSQFKYLEDVNELIGRLFHRTDLASNEIWELSWRSTSLHQCIEHRQQDGPGKLVSITYTLFENRIEFEIGDEGKGFSDIGRAEPDRVRCLVRERGRGIFLVSQVVDQIELC